MILVADASFAAKVLLREHGTEIAQRWWADEAVIWLAPAIIGAEVEAAIAVHYRNHPEMLPTRATLASTSWANMLDGIVLHVVNRILVDSAISLIRDYGPLRGADALYVAAAVKVAGEPGSEVVLGSFDRQQRRAAQAAGIAVTA